MGRCLGMVEGASVKFTIQRNVPEAQKVSVEPADSSDWELVELHAEHMEEQLLNQVYLHSPIVFCPF